MKNSLVLLSERDFILNGHGGARTCRLQTIWLNGVRVGYHAEGTAASGYSTGAYFDRQVAADVARLEQAAQVKIMRARVRS